jgi:sec-independent protein translocase protein TatA
MLCQVIGDILQPTHLLFVLVVALLVLGPKRLPEVGRSLGRGLRDFRGALSGDDHEEPEISRHSAPAAQAPAAPVPQSIEETPAPTIVQPAVSPATADDGSTETRSAAEAMHPTSVENPPAAANSAEPTEQHVS